MRVLVTFPGRYGDLLWSLPTIRAISERFREARVDLLIAGEFQRIVPLLVLQSYLGSVTWDDQWSEGQGWQPPTREYTAYDRVFHLGYHRWPELALPVETERTLAQQWQPEDGPAPAIDLLRPWIEPSGLDVGFAFGFSDCWFELKYGLIDLVQRALQINGWPCCAPGSRWVTEGRRPPIDWNEAADVIGGAHLFFGDCSALHVLAVAIGIPTILVEPMEARWNPIFYPLGMDGPQVTVVKGLDGKPTYDSRHTAETLKAALAKVSA